MAERQTTGGYPVAAMVIDGRPHARGATARRATRCASRPARAPRRCGRCWTEDAPRRGADDDRRVDAFVRRPCVRVGADGDRRAGRAAGALHDDAGRWPSRRAGVGVVGAATRRSLVGVARAHGVPVTVLGGGSNVLVADAGVRGLTLRIARRRDECQDGRPACERMRASPSTGWSRWLAGRGLAGLEAWAGTPGTVGGAICGNAHFQGRLISEHVRSVRACSSRRARCIDVPVDAMGIRLRPQPHPALRRRRAVGGVRRDAGGLARRAARVARASLAFRKRTQPLHQASAGCIFQNPGPDAPVPDGRAAVGGRARSTESASRARRPAARRCRRCTPTSSSSRPGSRPPTSARSSSAAATPWSRQRRAAATKRSSISATGGGGGLLSEPGRHASESHR